MSETKSSVRLGEGVSNEVKITINQEMIKQEIVYHGSQEIVQYPIIKIAKYNKDFYYGLYCSLQTWKTS